MSFIVIKDNHIIKKHWLIITLATPVVAIALLAVLLLLKRPPTPIQAEPLVVTDSPYQTRAIDIALQTHFQDTYSGHHERGRALLAADFDLDGRLDFYVGNPGDTSFILRNTAAANGQVRFEQVQTLLKGDLAWGGVVGDFDNDGDYDLFISDGANEGIGYDYLFRNDFKETGELHFTDVTQQAGVAGPTPAGSDKPLRTASANARLADFDQDGDLDIFVSTNYLGMRGMLLRILRFGWRDYTLSEIFFAGLPGRNTLWRNDGNLVFTDVTQSAGLERFETYTRHSSWLDFDNDGDADLYENNMGGMNTLWRNDLAETGIANFTDVTAQFKTAADDVAFPFYSFASGTADMNNDGWEDIIAFYHAKPNSAERETGTYKPGHAIFINQQGKGFTNIAASSAINIGLPVRAGVMGCQVGDVSGDGYPDLLFGNGDPFKGTTSQLFLSDNSSTGLKFINATNIIDFPAPEQAGISYAPYPYRTHGTAFVDIDNDGTLEIAMVNGGPAFSPDAVREPNRLFKLDIANANYLKVKLTGDGKQISRDAIGTRLVLSLTKANGQSRTLYRTLNGGSAFSAHNDFTQHFYIGKDEQPTSLSIIWPNGKAQALNNGLTANTTLQLDYSGN